MSAGVLVATLILSAVPGYWRRLPEPLQPQSPWLLGGLLGLGVVVGELPNSFLKRQLRVAPGARGQGVSGLLMSIFDQGDFAPVLWLLLAPLWVMPFGDLLLAFVTVVAVHLALNVVGFALGARKTAI